MFIYIPSFNNYFTVHSDRRCLGQPEFGVIF